MEVICVHASDAEISLVWRISFAFPKRASIVTNHFIKRTTNNFSSEITSCFVRPAQLSSSLVRVPLDRFPKPVDIFWAKNGLSFVVVVLLGVVGSKIIKGQTEGVVILEGVSKRIKCLYGPKSSWYLS